MSVAKVNKVLSEVIRCTMYNTLVKLMGCAAQSVAIEKAIKGIALLLMLRLFCMLGRRNSCRQKIKANHVQAIWIIRFVSLKG